jgi:hypothetical protein
MFFIVLVSFTIGMVIHFFHLRDSFVSFFMLNKLLYFKVLHYKIKYIFSKIALLYDEDFKDSCFSKILLKDFKGSSLVKNM